MTHKQFDEYQEDLLNKVVGMKDTKGKEYSNSENRFANFERTAAELGLTNIQVAWVYTKKHLDGIASYCRKEQTLSEPIEGRIVDAIVYLTLIAGMIEEKQLDKIGKGFSLEGMEGSQNETYLGLEDANVGKHQPFEYDPTKTTK